MAKIKWDKYFERVTANFVHSCLTTDTQTRINSKNDYWLDIAQQQIAEKIVAADNEYYKRIKNKLETKEFEFDVTYWVKVKNGYYFPLKINVLTETNSKEFKVFSMESEGYKTVISNQLAFDYQFKFEDEVIERLAMLGDTLNLTPDNGKEELANFLIKTKSYTYCVFNIDEKSKKPKNYAEKIAAEIIKGFKSIITPDCRDFLFRSGLHPYSKAFENGQKVRYFK